SPRCDSARAPQDRIRARSADLQKSANSGRAWRSRRSARDARSSAPARDRCRSACCRRRTERQCQAFLLIAVGRRPLMFLLLAEQLPHRLGDALRLEAVFSQELLERRRGAECLHADDAARLAYITLPAESGGLLYRHARGDLGRQHARPIRLALILEDIPRWH